MYLSHGFAVLPVVLCVYYECLLSWIDSLITCRYLESTACTARNVGLQTSVYASFVWNWSILVLVTWYSYSVSRCYTPVHCCYLCNIRKLWNASTACSEQQIPFISLHAFPWSLLRQPSSGLFGTAAPFRPLTAPRFLPLQERRLLGCDTVLLL
jgi:hypothetical protein